VVKICRHPPQSTKYVEWAVPFRVEGNELSRLADVELNSSKRTVGLLLHELSKLALEAALARVARVRQRYGPQVLLFEAKAFVHARAEQSEQAEVSRISWLG